MNLEAYENEIDTGQNMENCSFCMAVHKNFLESSKFRTLHCFLCNRCASKDIDVEDYSNLNLATLMDIGFGCVEDNELSELGAFKWVCQG